MRALVLSGGGSKGAFQVGKIKKLTEEGHRWNLVTGVSVGALNAAFLGKYNIDHQDTAAKELERLWLERVSKNSSVYEGWLPGILTYIPAVYRGSVWSTRPLRALLQDSFASGQLITTDTRVIIGVTSVTTGEYKTVNKFNASFIDYVLASASFPIAFPAVEIDGELWTDGGVRTVVPILDAIKAGATDIDVVMTSPVSPVIRRLAVASSRIDHSTTRPLKIIPMALRVTDILLDEVFSADLEKVQASYPNVTIRIHAPEFASKKNSLDFDANNIRTLLLEGYQQEIKVPENEPKTRLGRLY